jgi:hypothetical protein
LSDSAVTAGVGVLTGGFAFVGPELLVVLELLVGGGFVLALRGVVRFGSPRSRGALSLVRFGSTKTPALPVRSPSCARRGFAPRASAASAQMKKEGSLRRRRTV